MTTLRDQVRAFHAAMGVVDRDTPGVPDDETVRLRLRLITEEYFEALISCGLHTEALHDARQIIDHEIEHDEIDVDLPDFVDALADIDYVAEGTRAQFGVDGGPIADAVHAANMLKAGGTRRADGKIGKPEGWQSPDVAWELSQQGWNIK